jgi:hypothetical protein
VELISGSANFCMQYHPEGGVHNQLFGNLLCAYRFLNIKPFDNFFFMLTKTKNKNKAEFS